MIITKYFNAEQNWDHYAGGSFKIGTLAEYRGSETGLARMNDSREGKHLQVFGRGQNYRGPAVISGLGTIQNLIVENCGTLGAIGHTFNEHLFCASVGRYDPIHHEQMMNGVTLANGDKYEGNEDLDSYAEIRVTDFKVALWKWLKRQPILQSKLGRRDVVFGQRVKYSENFYEKEHAVPLDGRFAPKITSDDYYGTLFTKPTAFSPEREFRIVVATRAPMLTHYDLPSLYPQSEELRKCIVKMGSK